jgi:hypothetical protein
MKKGRGYSLGPYSFTALFGRRSKHFTTDNGKGGRLNHETFDLVFSLRGTYDCEFFHGDMPAAL